MMKVGPKIPGAGAPPQVEGPKPGERRREAGETGDVRGFAEVLGATKGGAAAGVGALPSGSMAEILAQFRAGELTRPEAARRVAEAAVRSWPAGLAGDAARARAVEEMAEYLAADPTFSALLDAAAGGSR